MEKIILLGAGGHAKTIVDTIERIGRYEICGFVDRGEVGIEVYHSYKVIGNDEDLEILYEEGVHNAFVSVGFMGNSPTRERLYDELLRIGYHIPAIIDDTAIIAQDVMIGEGTYIGRNSVVNADAKIGKMCIINSSAVVEHECVIGDFSHVSVSAVICGQSKVGRNVMIGGANSTIIQNVLIGDNCIVGAGSLVLKDLEENAKAVGVPIKRI